MKRKYKQAYAILVAFVIVAAAYTCRMLAMYDIGGKYPSTIRAVLCYFGKKLRSLYDFFSNGLVTIIVCIILFLTGIIK